MTEKVNTTEDKIDYKSINHNGMNLFDILTAGEKCIKCINAF